MLNNRYTILFATFLAAVFLTAGTAVASSEDADSKNNGRYIVVPGKSTPMDFGILTISSNIVQAQTNWHYKYVTGYSTSLSIDLDWLSSANSLRLTIYTPSQVPMGPYYDNIDGSVNGRITFDIINYNGLEQGTWSCVIYGQKVSGMESYTI